MSLRGVVRGGKVEPDLAVSAKQHCFIDENSRTNGRLLRFARSDTEVL